LAKEFIKKSTLYLALNEKIEGKMISSEELAEFIKEQGVRGNSNIAFVIGGKHTINEVGFSEKLTRSRI
jgi:23S rRNA (pseudouridine1915-N3)-methyltransferase